MNELCRLCGCCSARWHTGIKGFTICNRCDLAKYKHNFANHFEYDRFLDKGCWVCGKSADRIDHDHDIHPKQNHSCEACRRGPACVTCNNLLKVGRPAAWWRAIAAKLEASKLELAA